VPVKKSWNKKKSLASEQTDGMGGGEEEINRGKKPGKQKEAKVKQGVKGIIRSNGKIFFGWGSAPGLTPKKEESHVLLVQGKTQRGYMKNNNARAGGMPPRKKGFSWGQVGKKPLARKIPSGRGPK